jgi:HTH-type transcriptional regulator/antitoxin HipB
MTAKNKNLKSLDQFIDEKIGKKGTEKREQFEHDYDAFKLGCTYSTSKRTKRTDTGTTCRLGGNK